MRFHGPQTHTRDGMPPQFELNGLFELRMRPEMIGREEQSYQQTEIEQDDNDSLESPL